MSETAHESFRFGDPRGTDTSDAKGGCCGKPGACTVDSDGCLHKRGRPRPMSETATERRAPVNGSPGGSISWTEHVEAWEAYARMYSGQDAETIAARGGFGLVELLWQLGHMPVTWKPGTEALRQFDRSGVTFTPVALAPVLPAQPSTEDGYICRHGKLTTEHGCDDHRDHAWSLLSDEQRAAELRMIDAHLADRAGSPCPVGSDEGSDQ